MMFPVAGKSARSKKPSLPPRFVLWNARSLRLNSAIQAVLRSRVWLNKHQRPAVNPHPGSVKASSSAASVLTDHRNPSPA